MNNAHLRILDAALNRAGEGLRVVEDYVRFVLDDPFLTRQIKTLRHELSDSCRVNSRRRPSLHPRHGCRRGDADFD